MSAPFSTEVYVKAQTNAIRERMSHFTGKLYLEVGGKFLFDAHASRVLKGFDPACKARILKSVQPKFDIILCVNAQNIIGGRVWEEGRSNSEALHHELEEFQKNDLPRPKIAVNLFSGEPEVVKLAEELKVCRSYLTLTSKGKGYQTYFRHPINGYPKDVETVLGPNGFGKDDYIHTEGNLVIVTSLGSSCGKMSTCLGQIYLDTKHGLDSGYAKYELFPIWNIALDHPINLAYEAATADIGDSNAFDELHEKAYGVKSVNYNRDIGTFPLLQNIMTRACKETNYTRTYKSPTDMGINMAAEAIIDDAALRQSSIAEIESRIESYTKLVESGNGKQEWVETCKKVLERAKTQL